MSSIHTVVRALSVSALLAGVVKAQYIFPNCSVPAANWTFNEKKMSPCEVAAMLEGQCAGHTFNISALTTGNAYGGPKLRSDSTPCLCSSVSYSMVSACAICQGQGFNSWNIWNANCAPTDISVGTFPLTLPQGLAVPTWAYLNISLAGTFDENQAIAIAGETTHAPDSTAAPTPTVTSGSGSSGSGSDNGSGSSSGKSTSHAGAIAGGVVGGLAGLAIIAGLIWFFLRRRSYTHPRDQFAHEKFDLGSPPPTSMYSDGYTQSHTMTTASVPPMKLYDPNDPSTFPQTPVSTYATSTPPPGSVTSYGQTGNHNRGLSDGTYRGVPEI